MLHIGGYYKKVGLFCNIIRREEPALVVRSRREASSRLKVGNRPDTDLRITISDLRFEIQEARN